MFFFDQRLGHHRARLSWLQPTHSLSNFLLYPMSYALVLYGLCQSGLNFLQNKRLVLWLGVIAQLFVLGHCISGYFLYFGYGFSAF